VSVVLLPHATSSVAVARRHLSADLLSAGTLESIVDDATVVVSELLSNALRHARPLETGQIRVAWSRHGDAIEVAVSDGGATTEPRRSRPTLSSLGGRGLAIVEMLAECWGVRHENGGGTTVWAILRNPQPARQAQMGTTGSPPAVVSVIPDVSATPTVNLLNGTR
jgi:anti-sigma regulatory factor (Ser/Thr protein kinase)